MGGIFCFHFVLLPWSQSRLTLVGDSCWNPPSQACQNFSQLSVAPGADDLSMNDEFVGQLPSTGYDKVPALDNSYSTTLSACLEFNDSVLGEYPRLQSFLDQNNALCSLQVDGSPIRPSQPNESARHVDNLYAGSPTSIDLTVSAISPRAMIRTGLSRSPRFPAHSDPIIKNEVVFVGLNEDVPAQSSSNRYDFINTSSLNHPNDLSAKHKRQIGGKRCRPLDEAARRKASLVRSAKACLGCRLRNVSCSLDEVCLRCQTQSEKIPGHVCIRTNWSGVAQLFFTSKLDRYMTKVMLLIFCGTRNSSLHGKSHTKSYQEKSCALLRSLMYSVPDLRSQVSYTSTFAFRICST